MNIGRNGGGEFRSRGLPTHNAPYDVEIGERPAADHENRGAHNILIYKRLNTGQPGALTGKATVGQRQGDGPAFGHHPGVFFNLPL